MVILDLSWKFRHGSEYKSIKIMKHINGLKNKNCMTIAIDSEKKALNKI